MLDDLSLAALTPEGELRWTVGPLPGRVMYWAVSGNRLALGLQTGDLWIVDAAGTIVYQANTAEMQIPFAAPAGEFLVLSGSTISAMDGALTATPLFETGTRFASNAQAIVDGAGDVYLYPGEGRGLYAYRRDGSLRWIAYMPGSHLRAPRLGIGGGQLLYVVTTDGQLLAYATGDGRLAGQLALYNGGSGGTPTARWLDVAPDDTVRFSSGFLTLATLNGLAFLTPAEF
jgi:hypothetical protein